MSVRCKHTREDCQHAARKQAAGATVPDPPTGRCLRQHGMIATHDGGDFLRMHYGSSDLNI